MEVATICINVGLSIVGIAISELGAAFFVRRVFGTNAPVGTIKATARKELILRYIFEFVGQAMAGLFLVLILIQEKAETEKNDSCCQVGDQAVVFVRFSCDVFLFNEEKEKSCGLVAFKS